METVIKNNEKTCSSENNSYYWLIYDWLKNIISMNPYDNLESEQTRIEGKRSFIIDNKDYLCDHGGLYSMIARKGNIPQEMYTINRRQYL